MAKPDTKAYWLLFQIAAFIHIGQLVAGKESQAINADLPDYVYIEFVKIVQIVIFLGTEFRGLLFGPGIQVVAGAGSEPVGQPVLFIELMVEIYHQRHGQEILGKLIFGKLNTRIVR